MYYTRQTDPYTWATAKAAIGLVYSVAAKAGANDLISKSIQNYEEALDVLTEMDYPEDWKEISGKLSRLRRRASRPRE
jgi:hypothetical protein